MKLYYNPASPFVAKVLIIANECGLADKIEKVSITLGPGNPDHEYAKQNPLRQIPTLITDDGESLYDSFVICDYLIQRAGNKTLLPESGPNRIKVLQRHALCNGAAERAVATRYETFARPEQYRWPEMVADNLDRIRGSLALLNDTAGAFDGPFDLSQAAFVTLLRYLDFRFSDTIDWRADYPNLVEPFESLNAMGCVEAAYA